MFKVNFNDSVHGEIEEIFDTFDDAMEFWNQYADTETCIAGRLYDDENNEVIWDF